MLFDFPGACIAGRQSSWELTDTTNVWCRIGTHVTKAAGASIASDFLMAHAYSGDGLEYPWIDSSRPASHKKYSSYSTSIGVAEPTELSQRRQGGRLIGSRRCPMPLLVSYQMSGTCLSQDRLESSASPFCGLWMRRRADYCARKSYITCREAKAVEDG
jgi:hypothetical protein